MPGRILVGTGSLLVAGLFTPLPLTAQSPDEIAIRRVIEDAYVSGVFITRDTAAVKRGFHPQFTLSVLQGNELLVVPLDRWLERLRLDGRRSDDRVEPTFERIDVVDRTAHVKLRLAINGRHVYTDYMGLYRFPEGWRIVNKVFQSHD